MRALYRTAAVALFASAVFAASASAQQLGLSRQMAPPYTTYSPTFPTYQPAPVIGGFQQMYQPPVYQPPATTYVPSYPQYLAPGFGGAGSFNPSR